MPTTARDFYLVNLSGVEDTLIQTAFSQIGPIRRFTRRTNERGDYGFICFEQPQNVQTVLSIMDKKQFGNQTIGVQVSRTAMNNNNHNNSNSRSALPPRASRVVRSQPILYNAASRSEMIEGPYQIHIFDIDPDGTKHWQWKQIKEFASIARNSTGHPIRVRLCDVIPASEDHGTKASIHYENKQMMEEAFFFLDQHVRSFFGDQATMACYAPPEREERKQSSTLPSRPDTPQSFHRRKDEKMDIDSSGTPPKISEFPGFSSTASQMTPAMWNPLWMSMMMANPMMMNSPTTPMNFTAIPKLPTAPASASAIAAGPTPMDLSAGDTDLVKLLEKVKTLVRE